MKEVARWGFKEFVISESVSETRIRISVSTKGGAVITQDRVCAQSMLVV
jgi:hypothetical protein